MNTIPVNQTFSFSFNVVLPGKEKPTEIKANMRWTGLTWDTHVEPKTSQKLSREVLEEIEQVAERHGESLMQAAGYQIPAPAPTKVTITIKESELSPVEQLRLAASPNQINTGEPTNYLAFQNGVLMQLWRGTVETWTKGSAPTVTPWEQWVPVSGQESE